MNQRYKELFKNTSLLTISNFSSRVLIFLLVPLYTNILTTSEYGFYDLVHTSFQLLYPLCTAGIAEAVVRFLLDGNSDRHQIVSIGYKHIIISIIPVFCILLVNLFLQFSTDLASYSGYIFIFYILFALHSLQGQILKGENKVKIIAISGIIATITTIAANILFLLVFNLGLKGYYLANIIGELFPTLYISVYTRQWKLIKKPSDKKLEKAMILYATPMIVNSIGWWMNNSSDRYTVSIMCGVDVNGLLSVAYKIPTIVSAFGSFFIQAWQISAVKEYSVDKKSPMYKELFVYMNCILTLISGLLILLSHPIAQLMFGNFTSGWIYVPFLIMSALFNQSAGYVGPILSAEMNSKAIGRSAVIGLVANVILNVLLTLVMGPIGVTIATAISSFLIFFFRERASNKTIRSRKYYYVIASWIILIIESILVLWLKSISVSVIPFAGLILLYKETLTTLIKKGFGILKLRASRR